MAKKYKLLEHPAELRIRIYGKTKEELFKNAALALADILKHNAKLRMNANTAKKERLKIKSVDIDSLLVNFLNEILARSQINKCVYKISELKTQNSLLSATLIGYPVDHFDEDIKAVTYQDVDIKLTTKNLKLKTKEWQTDLVFDI